MPRGRPKKIIDPEILPSENDQPRGRKQLVDAEHTIKYTSPVPVTVEDNPEDAELELLDDLEGRPKKKKNNEREELRKILAKNSITPATQLKLTIERYLHSETSEGGTWAETEHCTRYPCTKEHIISEDYLDAARKWGVGTYRFTLRMQHQIVTAWDKRISTGMPGTVVQHTIPGDPTSPQVIVQSDGQQHVDPFKEAERALNFVKKYNDAFLAFNPQTKENPDRNEDDVLATAILKRPEVIDNVVGSVIKRFGVGGKDDEPWYADVVRDAVKNGQAVQIVKTAIDGIFNGFSGLFPGRQDNRQAQGTTQPQTQTHQAMEQTESNTPALNSGTNADASVETGQQQTVSPEEQALALVIDHCQKKIPPQVAFTRLMAYADAINEQAPQYSIDGYLEMFGTMTPDQALEFVKTLPNGEAIVALDHTKAWTEQLQKLIRESQEGEGE